MNGIDVSTHNGPIDWPQVRGAGIYFAMIRAGYGNVISQTDRRFEQNWAGAQAAGVLTGVYWFSYAYTVEMAREEAAVCLRLLAGRRLELPVAYDFEYDSVTYAAREGATVTPALVNDMAAAFTETIRRAGYESSIYTNYDYLSRYYDMARHPESHLWLAVWGANRPSLPHAIWQYSATGSVPGITGYVDLNRSDAAFEVRPRTPAEVPDAPDVPVTHTVAAGDTLSGIAKKFGTSYQAIAAANGIANPNLIFPGQVLRIPR